jgi:ACS family hexuronate transporter-like MFS transporter
MIPWIILRFGWRAAFLSTGIIGASWIVWWISEYHRPEDHPGVSATELKSYPEEKKIQLADIPWGSLFGYRQTWGFVLAKFLTDPVWWF